MGMQGLLLIHHTVEMAQSQLLFRCRSLFTVAWALCRLCLATNDFLIPRWRGDDLCYRMGLFHPWLLCESPQWLVAAHGVECCWQGWQRQPGARILHALAWRRCWYPPLINVISGGWRWMYQPPACKAPEAGQGSLQESDERPWNLCSRCCQIKVAGTTRLAYWSHLADECSFWNKRSAVARGFQTKSIDQVDSISCWRLWIWALVVNGNFTDRNFTSFPSFNSIMCFGCFAVCCHWCTCWFRRMLVFGHVLISGPNQRSNLSF